jgi:hypothetical protein
VKRFLLAQVIAGLVAVPNALAAPAHTVGWGRVSHRTADAITVGSTSCTIGPRSPQTNEFPSNMLMIASCTDGVLAGLLPSPASLSDVVVMNTTQTVRRAVSGTRLGDGCRFKMPTIFKASGLPLLGDKITSYDLATCKALAEIGLRSLIGEGPRATIAVRAG